ncbi:MAG: radical SAM family heme chaperone HemW [Limnochordia bacterium]|nr:radical SAM family heme chaperone HemW [Limnochordia bacterium]
MHIPFCESKCPYCDFLSFPGYYQVIDAYLQALEAEMDYISANLQRECVFDTIYFGGGTPSLLSPPQLERILAKIHRCFEIKGDLEVTLEANPCSLSLDKLQGYKQLGVNRLSLGVQSLNAGELRTLGRLHDADAARETYLRAQNVGFSNISVDLIFGIPGQSLANWHDTLEEITNWAPPHISTYCLTVEPQTPLGELVASGRVVMPTDSLQARMYTHTIAFLKTRGYDHYEISNFTRHQPCRHNLHYWRNDWYLGFGLGAHSHFGHARFANEGSLHDYLPKYTRTQPGVYRTYHSPYVVMQETMFMGLRLLEGVSVPRFRERFNRLPIEVFHEELEYLEQAGLVDCSCDRIKLTPKGVMFGNQAFVEFV